MTNHATSLGALLADPSRATQVPREEAIALLAALSTLQMALLAAASRPPTAVHSEAERPEPDRMLGVEEVAALTGLSRRWIYRNAPTLPFARKLGPRTLRFTRSGLTKWLATKRL